VSERPTLVIEGGDYEFTLGLGGAIDGVEVMYRPRPLPDIYRMILSGQPFEACEFSLSNTLMMRDRGETDLLAIPVFANRAFRHGALLVRKDSSLTDPSALCGKRIGVVDYTMTAAVWARGLLNDEYGVHWSELDWYSTRGQRFPPPESAPITLGERDPEDLLIGGELDVLVSPRPRDSRLPLSERRLRPLIPDPTAAERAYFEKTRIFPINHVVVVRESLLSRLPNAASVIFQAYAECKRAALKRRLGTTFMPWSDRFFDETLALFGDPHPFGLTPTNRGIVSTLIGYLVEQKLSRGISDLESAFAPGSARLSEATFGAAPK
jgi:4,5-dihydroxyphthalate decarboxylase